MAKFQISEYGTDNKKVIFLLAGWHNKHWMFYPFAKILQSNGFYCILYVYDGDVLSPDTKKTVTILSEVCDDILQKISILKSKGYNDFSVFGTSLGSLIALMAADKSPFISKIILNTTGADLAESIWSWEKVNIYFKKDLLSQKFTLKKLQTVWEPINPIRNINNLQNKKILIYLSLKDQLIPYPNGKQLVIKLKNRGYMPKVIVNNYLGHLLTGTYNLVNSKTYIKFLNN